MWFKLLVIAVLAGCGRISFDHASILSTGNRTDPYPSTYIRLSPGSYAVQVDQNNFSFAGDLPRDRWVCLELHIVIDGIAGRAELTIDGSATMVTSDTDTLVGTGYTGLDVGLHYATPGEAPLMMWVDEVIADTSPIGCN